MNIFSNCFRFGAACALVLTVSACGPEYPDNYAGGYSNDYPGNYGYASVNGWSDEDAYWQQNYSRRPYYAQGYGYEEYQPAYYFGVDIYNRHPGQRFDRLSDAELRAEWEHSHHNSHMDWNHARPAARDAYTHYAQQHAATTTHTTTNNRPNGDYRTNTTTHTTTNTNPSAPSHSWWHR